MFQMELYTFCPFRSFLKSECFTVPSVGRNTPVECLPVCVECLFGKTKSQVGTPGPNIFKKNDFGNIGNTGPGLRLGSHGGVWGWSRYGWHVWGSLPRGAPPAHMTHVSSSSSSYDTCILLLVCLEERRRLAGTSPAGHLLQHMFPRDIPDAPPPR